MIVAKDIIRVTTRLTKPFIPQMDHMIMITMTMMVMIASQGITPMNDLLQLSMTYQDIQDSRMEKPLMSGRISVEGNKYGGADSLLLF